MCQTSYIFVLCESHYDKYGKFIYTDHIIGLYASERLAEEARDRQKKIKKRCIYNISKRIIRNWVSINTGDRVRFADSPRYLGKVFINKTGTIVSIKHPDDDTYPEYHVKLDDHVSGDMCISDGVVAVFGDEWFEPLNERLEDQE